MRPRASLGVVKNRKIFASDLFPVRSSGIHLNVTYGLIYPGPNSSSSSSSSSSSNNNNNQISAETVLTDLLHGAESFLRS